MKRCIFISCVLVLAACGGGDANDAADADPSDAPTTVAPAAQTEPTEITQAPPDEAVASDGAGGITLTIGDQTWEFPGAGCAYLNAEPGSDGSEWNVSMVHGDLQVYINDDSFGSFVSITDIVNYGDLEWVAEGDAVLITVDGNRITAEGTFTDAAVGTPDLEGTLTATCPGWVSG